jgi:hypothetical protein
MPLQSGDKLGPYEIVALIGRDYFLTANDQNRVGLIQSGQRSNVSGVESMSEETVDF